MCRRLFMGGRRVHLVLGVRGISGRCALFNALDLPSVAQRRRQAAGRQHYREGGAYNRRHHSGKISAMIGIFIRTLVIVFLIVVAAFFIALRAPPKPSKAPAVPAIVRCATDPTKEAVVCK
jgi:hypothetical protein